MRVNPGVEFSKRKQMRAQPPRTICGKENCAPTPSSAGSVALLGVRRSPGTPGLRRRMLKDDLLELLATARLSDLQAELRGLSPASLTPTTAGGFIQAAAKVGKGEPVTEARATVTTPPTVWDVQVEPSQPGKITPKLGRVELFQGTSTQFARGASTTGASPDGGHTQLHATCNTQADMHSAYRGRNDVLEQPACDGTQTRKPALPGASAGEPAKDPCRSHKAAAARKEITQVECVSEVSPTTLMQIEINRRREALFASSAEPRPRAVLTSEVIPGNSANVLFESIGVASIFGSAGPRTSGAKSHVAASASGRLSMRSGSGSRRESPASVTSANASPQELDQGESAGALKFREMRLKLDGHKPTPKTGVKLPSPSPLWGTRKTPTCLLDTSRVHDVQERGASISSARQAPTPALSLGASPESLVTPSTATTSCTTASQRSTPAQGMIRVLPSECQKTQQNLAASEASITTTAYSLSSTPCIRSDFIPTPATPPASPLSEFISLFQTAQDQIWLRQILLSWRRRCLRLSAGTDRENQDQGQTRSGGGNQQTTQPLFVNLQEQAQHLWEQLQHEREQKHAAMAQRDAAQRTCAVLQPALAQAVQSTRRLLLSRALGEWRTKVKAARYRERMLQVQQTRFRGRASRRACFAAFCAWALASNFV